MLTASLTLRDCDILVFEREDAHSVLLHYNKSTTLPYVVEKLLVSEFPYRSLHYFPNRR